MYLKISKYISVAVISLLLPFASYAQQTESEKAQQTVEDLTKKEAPVFGGVALSGDPDTSKTASSWFGACIFLIVAATILRSFFL